MSGTHYKIISGLLVGISFLVPVCGCAGDVANRYYGSARYDAVPVSEVQVLLAPPAEPFDIIADFQARNADARFMQKQAAEIGADAVIVTYLGGQVKFSQTWASQPDNGTFSRIAGTAIRYK